MVFGAMKYVKIKSFLTFQVLKMLFLKEVLSVSSHIIAFTRLLKLSSVRHFVQAWSHQDPSVSPH